MCVATGGWDIGFVVISEKAIQLVYFFGIVQ